jgi:Zn-dependent peptidase ImmA (M78 family)
MISVPRKLIEIGWGDRVLTYEDFEGVADGEGIWVYRKQLRYDDGLFYFHRERPIIVLNKNLMLGDLAWKAHHELTHYFLHPPALRYFAHGTTDKADYEANYVSSIGCIPTRLVETATWEEIQEEYGYPNDLKWVRMEYYSRYKR